MERSQRSDFDYQPRRDKFPANQEPWKARLYSKRFLSLLNYQQSKNWVVEGRGHTGLSHLLQRAPPCGKSEPATSRPGIGWRGEMRKKATEVSCRCLCFPSPPPPSQAGVELADKNWVQGKKENFRVDNCFLEVSRAAPQSRPRPVD